MDEEMDIMLDDHEQRLKHLEENQEKFSRQMADMQTGLTEIENTVMRGNLSTQEIQKEIKELQKESSEKVDRVFDILVDQFKTKSQNETDLKKARLSMWERIFVALAGAGGLATGIVTVVSEIFK